MSSSHLSRFVALYVSILLFTGLQFDGGLHAFGVGQPRPFQSYFLQDYNSMLGFGVLHWFGLVFQSYFLQDYNSMPSD